MAIVLLGRKTFTRFANETEVRIVSPAERGRVVILIASAAALDAGTDVASAALANLDAAAAKVDDLVEITPNGGTRSQRGTIAPIAPAASLTMSPRTITYLYLMAATSRGVSLKFNGMLWNTAGNLRRGALTLSPISAATKALFAANRIGCSTRCSRCAQHV